MQAVTTNQIPKAIQLQLDKMIKSKSYSCCEIWTKESLFIDNFPFSPKEYSRFKFGDKTIARKFGQELAASFIENFLSYYLSEIKSRQIVVVSSPYCFIPTATFAMKDYFVQALNTWLVNNGNNVVQESKIHRTITYTEDYGGLTSQEREKLIGNDGFYVDKEFLKDKFVLYLDDIRITGSHERVIRKMISDLGIDHEYMFLYYAQLESSDIHPSIENELNYAFVKTLLDLNKIIRDDNFLFNTRVVKYILNSSHEEFQGFIHYQSTQFCNTLYHLALGNSYHLIDSYKQNFKYLSNFIH